MKVIKVIEQRAAVYERTVYKVVIQARQGLPGRDGMDGSSAGVAHAQSVPAAVWTVAHNMGKHPAVAVVDSAGGTVYGDIRYLDINTVTLTFSGAFAGFAYFN